jgi:spermidine synthase
MTPLRDRAPHLAFLVSSACIMVVELVASRLIASHLGSSLYTWSAVIGVMLAGISAGNVVGGRLADRFRPEAVLGWLFLAAAAACAAALGLNALFAAARPLRALAWPLQILLAVVAIFTLPAVALGTISPSLAKIAVQRAAGPVGPTSYASLGATLGSFYAYGALGSIVGTFFTGFWLLFALGNTRTIGLTAAVLAVLGLASAMAAWTGVHVRLKPDATDVPVHVRLKPDATCRSTNGSSVLAWRYAPHAIVFFASACLMVVELLASRIIADQAGSSLYTWTSVIGVVLAGMSAGGWAAGVLSDRVAPHRFLGWLFLAASISCASTLVLAYAFWNSTPFGGWHWPAVIFATVAAIFFVPSALLGAFGPVAAKLAVQHEHGVGRALGSVSAWNSAGSITGTLVSGFWLISVVGSRSLALLVAVLLGCAGLLLGPRRLLHLAWTAVAVAGFVLTRADLPLVANWQHAGILRPSATDAFDADSAYQHVRVYASVSEVNEERRLRVLALDYLIHGYVDLTDPGYLNYDYERIYRDVALRYAAGKARPATFFLGGGSYTFPRWVMHRWPGSVPVVAEIDPVVLEANHRALGLPRKTPIRTILGDARNTIDGLRPDERFDLVFGDAFNDLSVPYHLTTLEFTRTAASHLRPDGAYLVNVIDSFGSGLFLGSFVNTLRQVFPHVYVFCTDKSGVTDRRDTFVVAASFVPLDTAGWEPRHGTDFEGSALTSHDLTALVKKAGGRVLTDDSAPVENLLAPIVRERTQLDR